MTRLTRSPAFGAVCTFHPLCSVFPRGARKNRTPIKIRYRYPATAWRTTCGSIGLQITHQVSRIKEDAAMPDFPIVDAHVHLWDPQHFAIPWLEGNAMLNQRYTTAEYAEHTQGVAIEALVYLEVDVNPHYALL